MLDACRQAGVVLMTAFPMRFSAPVLEIKSLLGSGELGRLLACSATNQGQNPKRYRDWFVDKTLAGGGSVFDHTVHLADMLRWYLDSEVVEVYAQTNRIIHRDAVEVETAGLLMLTFADGAFASIDCSWSRPLNYPTWGGLTFDLICERGVVNVDAFLAAPDFLQQSQPDAFLDPMGLRFGPGHDRRVSVRHRRESDATGDRLRRLQGDGGCRGGLPFSRAGKAGHVAAASENARTSSGVPLCTPDILDLSEEFSSTGVPAARPEHRSQFGTVFTERQVLSNGKDLLRRRLGGELRSGVCRNAVQLCLQGVRSLLLRPVAQGCPGKHGAARGQRRSHLGLLQAQTR